MRNLFNMLFALVSNQQPVAPRASRKLFLEQLESRENPSGYSATSSYVDYSSQYGASTTTMAQMSFGPMSVVTNETSRASHENYQSGSTFVSGSAGSEWHTYSNQTIGSMTVTADSHSFSNGPHESSGSVSSFVTKISSQEINTWTTQDEDGRSVLRVTTNLDLTKTEKESIRTFSYTDYVTGYSTQFSSTTSSYDISGIGRVRVYYAHFGQDGWQDASYSLNERTDFSSKGSNSYANWSDQDFYEEGDFFSGWSTTENSQAHIITTGYETMWYNEGGHSYSSAHWYSSNFDAYTSSSASGMFTQFGGSWINSWSTTTDSDTLIRSYDRIESIWQGPGGAIEESYSTETLRDQVQVFDLNSGSASNYGSISISQHSDYSSRDYVLKTSTYGWTPEDLYPAAPQGTVASENSLSITSSNDGVTDIPSGYFATAPYTGGSSGSVGSSSRGGAGAILGGSRGSGGAFRSSTSSSGGSVSMPSLSGSIALLDPELLALLYPELMFTTM